MILAKRPRSYKHLQFHTFIYLLLPQSLCTGCSFYPDPSPQMSTQLPPSFKTSLKCHLLREASLTTEPRVSLITTPHPPPPNFILSPHSHILFCSFVLETLSPPLEFRWERICLQCRRPRFNPWIGKILWRRKWQPTPVFLPGKSYGQRSLAGYSPWGRKESDTTE